MTSVSQHILHGLALAVTGISVCATVDVSFSSPTTEDVVPEDGAAAVEGDVTAAEAGGTAVEGDSANVQHGFAAVVDGDAAESMAEAEGVQPTPQLAATACAPGSLRPCGPLPCLYEIPVLCPVLYGSDVELNF